MTAIFGALAAFERGLIRQRIQNGIDKVNQTGRAERVGPWAGPDARWTWIGLANCVPRGSRGGPSPSR